MYYIIWTLLLLFCLHCMLWSLFWRARRNFKHLLSYSQLPFLGSIHWLMGGGAMILRRLNDMAKVMDDTRLPFIFWLGPQPVLCPKKTNFKSVLDVLLDLNEKDPTMDLNHIRAEVHTVIVGGQETVAITLQLVLLMLGAHPNVQNILYNEVKQIFKDNKTDLTKENLSSLVYCEAVIQETLRLYPPFPIVTRLADRDLQIKSCTIPKGTLCCLHLWAACRSRLAWGEDADKFIPERWLLPLTSKNMAYLPFSIGRRSCIGKRYAMAFLKTILAHCVKDLIFASDADKLEFKMDIALRPIKGNLLEVKLRV